MFFNPLTSLLMILLISILSFFFFMVEWNVISLVFAKIGIPPRYIFSALFLILAGSFVNIPIKRIPQETMAGERSVRFFGVRYRIPPAKKPETVLAISVGGQQVPKKNQVK